MPSDRPTLGKDEILIVKVVEPQHLVVEIDHTRFHVRCNANKNNPPEGSLQPGNSLVVTGVNQEAQDPMTIVKRVSEDGQLDRGEYQLYEWEKMDPVDER